MPYYGHSIIFIVSSPQKYFPLLGKYNRIGDIMQDKKISKSGFSSIIETSRIKVKSISIRKRKETLLREK